MKSRLLYIISFIGLSVAFWACGDGSIYTHTPEDEIAIEKLGKLTDEDFEAMMEECRADSKCRAEMEKYPAPTSSNEPEALSSSSEKKPESSSEDESSSVDSSAADTTASSSDKTHESSSSEKDDESSSSVESSESTAESSSDKVESSSAESSSSSEDESSSSVESSSEETSSSEEDPVSSSSEPAPPESSSSAESSSSLLPPHGTCVLTNSEGKSVTAVKLNEPVTWTYVPDEGTSVEGSYFWNYGSPEDILDGGSRRNMSVKVRYSERGDFSVSFKIASVQVCDAVPVTVLSTVYEDPNVSSSSNDDSPEQSATSSTNPTSGGSIPGVTPGVTPEGGTSTSTASSSSAESSSSEASSSSEDVTPINEDMSGKTYQPGSYKVVFSNGLKSEVCNVHFEDHSNKINDVFKFPESEDGGLWDNDYGRTVTIVPGVEFSFTSGTLKIESCWSQSW